MRLFYLSPEVFKRVGSFDAWAVERLLGENDRRARNHETELWAVLSSMLWHELYISVRMIDESKP